MNNMHIVIDAREHKLIDKIGDTFAFERKQIDIGDIHVIDEVSDTIVCVIERKTVADLQSSIMDGRYNEQKARMIASGYRVLYIVETTTQSNAQAFGAIINTQVRDNIPVLMSTGILDTIRIIRHLQSKDACFFTSGCVALSTYTPIHTKKSKNVSHSEIYVHQLSLIPGISRAMGMTIMNQYPSMVLLIDAFRLHDNPANMLTSIPKIGKLISKRVFDVFFTDT